MGQYTYGDSYVARLRGKSAPFTLILRVEGSGKLTGECLDDGYENEADTRAVVEGQLINGQIEFVKRYRHYWTTGKDGSVTENRKRQSQEIHYAGHFRHGVFTGDWKIFTVFLREDGSFVEREVGGSWIMHKADDEHAV